MSNQSAKINPLRLHGLRQAIYILKCLEKGQTEQEIIKYFEGDSQLVELWINFLLDIHWIQKREMSTTTPLSPPSANDTPTWVVTDKAKEWTVKYIDDDSRFVG
jgi:hypothetical protein